MATGDGPEGGWPADTLLGQLTRETVAAMLAHLTETRFERGRVVIGEGDEGRDLFLVLSGAVRAASFGESGREVAFSEIGPGDCFGEIAALDGGRRSSSVVVTEAAVIGRVPRWQFQALLATRPDLSFAFLLLLCGKLRSLSERIVAFAELTAAQRLRRELLRLARAHRIGADEALIPKPLTQTELAARINARREAVAREVAELRRLGLIVRRADGHFVPSIRRLAADSPG